MAPAENPADAQIEFDLDAAPPENIQPTVDTAANPAGGPSTDAEIQQPDEIADLRKQLEDEKRLRLDAESRANTISAEKNVSDNRLVNEVNNRFAAQEQSIDVRAGAAKAALTSIKQEMVRAQSEQRYEDFATLQEQMADAKAEERQAGWEKQQITAHKERLKNEMEAAASRPQLNPSEQFLSSIPGERSRQWLRSHPDVLSRVISTPRELKRLTGAAQLAEGEGHEPDSDGYLAFIEEKLGLKEADPVVNTAPTKAAPKAPGQTASAAPSNRSATPVATTRKVTLDDVVRKLTPVDRANAKISFPGLPAEEAEQHYARGIVISKQRDPSFRPEFRL